MAHDPLPVRIKQVRETRGLTQAELADRAHLPPATISHFETGIRTPGTTTLRRLADALGTSVDYLLGRQSEPAASGPEVEAIFRNLSGLSASSLEKFRKISEVLKDEDERNRRE